MGQSIGLHVDASRVRHVRSLKSVERELRRRSWYSMYVLDRLLALQLGRPVTIHEADFDVRLPSRREETTFEINSELVPSREQEEGDELKETLNGKEFNKENFEGEASSMDYFPNVIQFSHIVGQVIRELYHPTQVESSAEDMLLSTSSLDSSLLKWKA